MNKESKISQKIFSLFFIVVVAITVIGIVKTIFISTDIDEAYAIAQSYRLMKGDQLILTMWEPHQLSAYFISFFLWIYRLLTGSMVGVVIYLRIIGTLIHGVIGFLMYKLLKKDLSGKIALLVVLLHMNFLAKWLQLPEFELISYWLMILGIILGLRYYQNPKKIIYLFMVGLLIFLQMLNYPTMILLFPIYVYAISKISENFWKDVFFLTLGAAVPGLVFLVYLFSYMDYATFRHCIAIILSDPSHMEVPFVVRMMKYAKEFLVDFLLFIIPYIILEIIFYKKQKGLAFTVVFGICTLIQIFGCIFGNQNQFFLQERYLLAAVFCIVSLINKNKRGSIEGVVFGFGILPAIGGVFAAGLLSNMTLSVAYSKLFVCVPIACVLLLKEKIDFRNVWKWIVPIGALGSLFVCKILLIRVTGCLPVTVRADMHQIKDGPAKGIFVLDEIADNMNEDYLFLIENINNADKMFYFGCENLTYLYTDAEICAASVQGTSVFNQDFLSYFERYPEKYPTVIVYDKSFEEIGAYRYSPWNYIVKDWILEQSYVDVKENDNMIIYRVK